MILMTHRALIGLMPGQAVVIGGREYVIQKLDSINSAWCTRSWRQWAKDVTRWLPR
jgi:hypothetical protein